MADTPQPERIAKVLARAGIGSRREIEQMIADRRVAVNGQVLDTPATRIDTLDDVTVDGKPVAPPEATRLWRYHKPRGLVTSHRDPVGRPTVFDALPAGLPRLISVGRLDIDSEGLLLFTNDGGLARWLELPATGLPRRYRVRVFGQVEPDALSALRHGVTVDGIAYGAIEASVIRAQTSNAWLSGSLTEGMNREVRRVMALLGLRVNRLVREAYGPFTLGQLASGAIAQVPVDQMLSLLSGYFSAPETGAVTGRAKPTTSRKGWARARPPKAKPRPGRRAKPETAQTPRPGRGRPRKR